MHGIKATASGGAELPTDVCPTFGADTLVADDAGGATLSFPGFCVAANGDFVAAYRRGASHNSTDGTVEVIVSSDQGASWSAATTVLSSASWDYRDSSLTCLRDGTIVLSQSRRTNSAGLSASGCVFLISTDHGQTWGAPIVVSDAFTSWVYGGAPILEQPDGTLLTLAYGFDTGDSFSSVRLLRSEDGGATWTVAATVADGSTVGVNCTESGLVRTPAGLVCLIRATPNTRRAVSTDNGLTWSTPSVVLSNATGWPKPIRLPDGRMVTVYRATSASNVGRVATSFDDGLTWTTCTDLISGGDKYAYGQSDVDDAGSLWVLHSYEHSSGDDGRIYLRSAPVPHVQDHTHDTFDIADLDVPSTLGDLDDVDTASAAIEGATVALVEDPDNAGQFVLGTVTASGGGAGELLMQDGVSSPPVPLETEDGTDWLYEG